MTSERDVVPPATSICIIREVPERGRSETIVIMKRQTSRLKAVSAKGTMNARMPAHLPLAGRKNMEF